jgi:hypothetical protein
MIVLSPSILTRLVHEGPHLLSQPECLPLANKPNRGRILISSHLLRELAIILFLPSPIQCKLHLSSPSEERGRCNLKNVACLVNADGGKYTEVTQHFLQLISFVVTLI